MSVTNQHSQYSASLAEWAKARAFAKSEKDVHAGGELYVSRLTGQTDDEYAAYKERGSVAMFFKKTISTYRGMVTRKEINVSESDSVTDYLTNVTGSGDTLSQYVYDTVGEFFTTGRCGTLIDLKEGLTAKDPQFLFYSAEAIINWREEVIDGAKQLSMVVLVEQVGTNTEDEFNTETENQYRVLDILDGAYRVRLFDANGSIKQNKSGDTEIFPLMNNKKIKNIPFVIHGGVAVKPPFLTEILDLNLHHYQTSTDYAGFLRYAANPLLWSAGADEEIKKVGFGTSHNIPDANGKVEFAQIDGTILPIPAQLKAWEEQMSVLAVNMVIEDIGGKTATQVSTDSGNQTASLAGTVKMLSVEFTKILGWACDWLGKPVGAVVELNTDFISKQMAPEMIREIRQSWFDGAISYETMWLNLQQGEIANPHKSAEEEQADIETSTPPGMQGDE